MSDYLSQADFRAHRKWQQTRSGPGRMDHKGATFDDFTKVAGEFEYAAFTDCRFANANLNASCFDGASLVGCTFDNVQLEHVSFDEGSLERTRFHKARMVLTSFTEVTLTRCRFEALTAARGMWEDSTVRDCHFDDVCFDMPSLSSQASTFDDSSSKSATSILLAPSKPSAP